MNDNYLWDRTGEPDPEIQKLEELLGQFRYQPHPLQIPTDLAVGRKRWFVLPMTIAAAILMVAILSALWFQFSRKPALPTIQSKQDMRVPPANVNQPESRPEQPTVVVKDAPTEQKPRRQLNRNLLALNRRPAPKRETFAPQLTPQEAAEKEQVMVALRLVSAKLNLAQRKTQGLPPVNTIRNQHKIG